MSTFSLKIDDRNVKGKPGQTILDVAKANGIHIPTLCYDERMAIYGSCGLCVVEVEGSPRLLKACATLIADNMVVRTDTEQVKELRKTNLELLLSNHTGDCRPPCVLACPAQTDCQGYVGLIANGDFKGAIELIRDRIPLPASLGRVCPHPCETECRRGLVEDPVSIQWLKRFAADLDMDSADPFVPRVAAETGKKVAIIGGGPFGLSSAYFLRQKGHSITIYEAMPKFGGMLRYGIPEYRLPKAVVDDEVERIRKMGVELRPNVQIGKDISFESLREAYDAVVVGIGAWKYTGARTPGEDLEGVIGGIDFLRSFHRGETLEIGEKVAIVGGGNTAMDACRTAVRHGAKKVYNVYRRTREDMPADEVEIVEGEEEGVMFKFLTNPLKYEADETTGRLKGILLQKMKQGEPDASGRRSPVPIEGETEFIEVDTVILAIGQAVNAAGFEQLDKTRKNAIAYDPQTYLTSMEGVFAGGDCGNDKISIAVESVADAKKSAVVIDAYLNGQDIKVKKPYVITRNDITARTFEDRERLNKVPMAHLKADERKSNFTEVMFGYTQEEAVKEAKRCLECGCHDYFECKLVNYANVYDVAPQRFDGAKNTFKFEDDHPFIVRDPNKCILCGQCVRACEEIVGVSALGLVNRGFDTVVLPTMGKKLAQTECISCGQCVKVCPVGALQERQTVIKPVPLATTKTRTTCGLCSLGCTMDVESHGPLLIKSVPANDGPVNKGMSCGMGRFGFNAQEYEGKLTAPQIRKAGALVPCTYDQAVQHIHDNVKGIAKKYGKDAIAVAISDRHTNEDAYAIMRFASAIGAKALALNSRKNATLDILGLNASPNTIDELNATDLILVTGFVPGNNPVLVGKLRKAVQNGAKLVVINHDGFAFNCAFADSVISVPNDLTALKMLAKALVDLGASSDAPGFANFKSSLNGVAPSEEIRALAKAYKESAKAMILFHDHLATVEGASLLCQIALLSGHIGSYGNGILKITSKNNSQGLVDLGITAGVEGLGGVKAVISFGEDLADAFKGMEFVATVDTHLTQSAQNSAAVIPAKGYQSYDGTFTNTERRLQVVRPAYEDGIELSDWQLAVRMAKAFGVELGFQDLEAIKATMRQEYPVYAQALEGKITSGVLAPNNPRFDAVADGCFAQQQPLTDNIMKMVAAKMQSIKA